MQEEPGKFGTRASSDYLADLVSKQLHKSYEYLAQRIVEAGGDSSDTLVCLQKKGTRRMTLDEALTVAHATDPMHFVRWAEKRLGVGEGAGAAAGIRESFRGCRRSMGRLLGGMEDATDDDGEDGAEVSLAERRALLVEVREHRAEIERLERALEVGLMPRAAKAGAR